MSYSITSTTRVSILATLLGTSAFLGACGPSRNAELSQSEQMLILEEIDLGSSLVGYEQSEFTLSSGPNLIAGDWLAIQCAQAGGYFDEYNWDGYDWTPVYANVIADYYE
ncbi:MAG: hypothetical protein JJ974_06500 [Phycisphaerales bacterium]|nr:hypothetical protein [Phycisphaerales bacterium]